MTAVRTDLVGIKTAIQSILTAANTTTASPIDLSANLSNSKRVVQILKIHPEMISPQASFFPLVTCYIPEKQYKEDQIASGQLNAKRESILKINVLGGIWNNNFATLDADPADEDISYLMENVELTLRSDATLQGKVSWCAPTKVTYYTTVLSEQTHLRSGILELECKVFY